MNNWFSISKESQQWIRQEISEETRRKRDEESTERRLVRDTYHDCISRLSLMVEIRQEEIEIPAEKKLKIYKDTNESLSILEPYRSGFNMVYILKFTELLTV
jgi:hypothetical protein